MQRNIPFVFILVSTTLFISCEKNNNSNECFPGSTTSRLITNKQALIKITATLNPVYIVEQGSIDTKLIPCNLPQEFMQNDLQVIISGEVKTTIQGGRGPCCTENFVVTKITR